MNPTVHPAPPSLPGPDILMWSIVNWRNTLQGSFDRIPEELKPILGPIRDDPTKGYPANWSEAARRAFDDDWLLDSRLDQLRPNAGPADWTTWLVMGGRGAGKTRTGAE
jgi:hypothetical protein